MRIRTIMTAVMGASLLGSAGMADQEVRDVRFGVDGERTRVVIETAEAADFRAFTLDGLSDRLVVDLPDMEWSVSGLDTGEGVGHGLVGDFAFLRTQKSTGKVWCPLTSTV